MHGASTFLDTVWGGMMADDESAGGGGLPTERRHGFVDLGERLVRLETQMATVLGEIGMLRPVVHRVVSEITTLVLLGEQHTRDHEAMMQRFDRIGQHLEQHDQRDDDRFTALGGRIEANDKRLTGLESTQAHKVAWRHAMIPAWIVAAATLIAVAFTLFGEHIMGGGAHP